MQQLKSGLGFDKSMEAAKTHSSMPDPPPMNDWSIEVLDDASYDAGYDVDQYAMDHVPSTGKAAPPAHPTATSIVNRTTAGAGMSIEELNAAFDMRESYLQRHSSPVGKYSDQTDLKINDFSTSTKNMWRSDDLGLFPDYNPPNCGHGTAHDNIYQAKVSSNF